MDWTRRDLAKLALAGLPLVRATAANDSTFGGVRVGINTFSFRGLQLDEVIQIVSAASIGFMEVESTFIEPGTAAPSRGRGPAPGGSPGGPPAPGTQPGATPSSVAAAGAVQAGGGPGRGGGGGRGMSPEQREALRKWRLSSPTSEFQAIRNKMDTAGIVPYAYNITINDTFIDEEIDAVFEMARAFGVEAMVTATTMPVAARLVPFAAKHKMRVGLHPSGSNAGADAIGSPESYRKAMTLSPNFGITLDLEQFGSWGPDPLAFIAEMHDRIVTLHAHDRKTGGAMVPFGEGDVPLKEILLQAKREHYTFIPMIERAYSLAGSDILTETKRSLDYFRRVLTS